jgi:hypothetical protein
VLFERRLREGIADGTITLAFRRWRRPQVVAGRDYRTGAGAMARVGAVDVVDPADIGDPDARRAGFASADEVRAQLRGDPHLPVYRIELRPSDAPDRRNDLSMAAALSAEERARLSERLRRMDERSPHGAWTAEFLRAIEQRPGVRAADLAARAGWGTAEFKANVRKLKELGLTQSLEVGYRLSPRGAAFLSGRGAPRSSPGRTGRARGGRRT